MPLYEQLLKTAKPNDCAFCVQWGENFPDEKNTGILFVGKAVNGWVTNKKEIEILFGNGKKRIFDREDQIKWVDSEKSYNARKSAFWRVVKAISQKQNVWSDKIAWSNLYKISPFEGGNPSATLKEEQLKLCREILKTEIEILSPKFVVMLVSDWKHDFLRYLNNNQPTKSICKKTWDKNYETKVYKINGTFFITSLHPQGKKEDLHVNTIVEFLKKY